VDVDPIPHVIFFQKYKSGLYFVKVWKLVGDSIPYKLWTYIWTFIIERDSSCQFSGMVGGGGLWCLLTLLYFPTPSPDAQLAARLLSFRKYPLLHLNILVCHSFNHYCFSYQASPLALSSIPTTSRTISYYLLSCVISIHNIYLFILFKMENFRV